MKLHERCFPPRCPLYRVRPAATARTCRLPEGPHLPPLLPRRPGQPSPLGRGRVGCSCGAHVGVAGDLGSHSDPRHPDLQCESTSCCHAAQKILAGLLHSAHLAVAPSQTHGVPAVFRCWAWSARCAPPWAPARTASPGAALPRLWATLGRWWAEVSLLIGRQATMGCRSHAIPASSTPSTAECGQMERVPCHLILVYSSSVVHSEKLLPVHRALQMLPATVVQPGPLSRCSVWPGHCCRQPVLNSGAAIHADRVGALSNVSECCFLTNNAFLD